MAQTPMKNTLLTNDDAEIMKCKEAGIDVPFEGGAGDEATAYFLIWYRQAEQWMRTNPKVTDRMRDIFDGVCDTTVDHANKDGHLEQSLDSLRKDRPDIRKRLQTTLTIAPYPWNRNV